ncbi:adenylate kinase 9 isoform X1 [Malaclemys terrapin pileata]|uniref:adenylate kinase 9 isoform X1 n=1 Tax=Malaclemys terrapin pileata TaxID=2991368 RepID=UPI0023A7D865|nr:adenylate kinase 9 isoform X1 [Malaclemys terrapin pileata]XP_053879144.1 adenylate kinase 9 isoform X1 [Malaclemys terrapin pileata]
MASPEKKQDYPFVDIFDEDEAEKSFLLSKPTCLIILGKPGTGKKTLARKIAQLWKCTLIEALEVIEENITAGTEYGLKMQELLFGGQSIPEELITKMILKKIESPEVAHFGYVLSGFPSLSEEYMTISEQIEKIRNLKLKPNFLINLKCPDYDLCQRLSGQRQHPDAGQIYQRNQWDPEIIDKRKKKKDQHKGEDEEEEEEEEQEEEDEAAADATMLSDILPHLVQRPEDFLENAEARINLYKDTMLYPLEDMMAEQDCQYLIELDGNKHPNELFASVIARLQSMGLRNGALITRLQNPEEELSEGMETDELFRTLSSFKIIAPRYRWCRSRWGRACPVALKEGNIVMGLPDLAVSFLGKMYLFSSQEALREFMLNPRPYLLPPMPLPPCKVVVFGPPLSGKTTLCNWIANKYKGKVLDMDKLIQPCMEEARKKIIEQARIDAIDVAISKVKNKLEIEKMLKEQAAIDAQETGSYKETDEYEESEATKPEEERSMEEQSRDTRSDTSKEKTDNSSEQEAESSVDTKDTTEDTSTSRTDGEGTTEELNEDTSINTSESEVTADHPEVQALVEEAVKIAAQSPIMLPAEVYPEVLEKAITELTKKNKDRFPGAPEKGGWVLDNYPTTSEHWLVLSEKGLLPDTVVCLKNIEKNGIFLLRRLYLTNKDEINSKILERLTDEALKKQKEEEETRRELQEVLKLKEENQQPVKPAEDKYEKYEEVEEHSPLETEQTAQMQSVDSKEEPKLKESGDKPPLETEVIPQVQPDRTKGVVEPKPEPEIMLPEFPEDGFPDVPEIEPFKEKIKLFMHDWQILEPGINDSSLIQTAVLEIAGQTPETLLNQIVLVMEKPFKYYGWEISAEDLDEEADDLQAEGEADEELEEEEQEENDEDEDKINEKKRHMGDTKHFCPVSLKENFILFPGIAEHGAIYREKFYYFSSPESREKFLENPEEYVAHKEPLQAPPLRVCLLGTHGAGKTICGRWLADKLGIFHIQFEERLQEMIMPKTEKRVGPEFDEEPEEDQIDMEALFQELGDSSQTNTETETESESAHENESNKNKEMKEVVLTDEEEIIKANIVDNEALTPEVLDKIVPEWWTKEPIRSTGFILDGFPRTFEEAQYLSERALCPDVAAFIQVEESDISDRLLPPRLKKWRDRQNKKMENKKKLKDMKEKIKEEKIAKRRAELLAEQAKKKEEAAAYREEEEASDEEDEDEEEDIEMILEEEFPKEEEVDEEEEEQEADAADRMKNEITEKYETDSNNLQGVQEELERLLIPQITINGGRKPHIVRYQLYSKLKHLVENRESIFEKCYPISLPLARKMLVLSYKHPSSFGQWDPIKLSEGDVIKPFQNQQTPSLPVIHRQYIYFFSSKENKEKFMKNPIKFIRQPKPKPSVPVKIAIVGPPKSGKTTVAKKFASVYGLMRLSVGDAIRLVLNNQPESELALMLKWHLHKGLTAPDELAIQALEVALMDHVCSTAGVVIDGYPVTRKQVSILEAMRIIPVKIFELQVDAKELFRRALIDKESTDSPPYPIHDSSQILAIQNSCYKKQIDAIRTYYEKEHQNWCVVDAFRSKWWVWNKIFEEVQVIIKQIQTYLERIREGKAASIADLCITPQELQSRLGEFGQYCPVSLAKKGELVDCSVTSSLQSAAEFRGHYYKMASQVELNEFLNAPELYVPPLAPHPLPSPDMLPKKLTMAEVKALFPKKAEMQGYCPVTYLDGKQRYEALVPGTIEYAVEYRDKLYIFESEEKLQKFMRLPEKYWNQKLPHKLPPIKEPVLLTALPLTGYLEQGIATALIKAMNEVGCLKPKFPFLSVKKTALLFVAYHLKAYNPRSSEYVRKKYKRKLEQFIDHCDLIPYLGTKMTRKYKEPQNRPIDFDHKLRMFLCLKDVDPTSG